MAFTFTPDTPRSRNNFFSGSEKKRNGLANLGNPYVVGGMAVTPSTFQLRTLDHLDVGGCSVDGALTLMLDKANMKIKAFTAFGTEAGAVDLSAAGKSFRVQASGR